MLDNLKKYKVVLASNSPRRKELLAGLDIDFEVMVIPGIEESYPSGLKEEDIPRYLACKKADTYLSRITDDTLLITADTVVWTFNELIGKPNDRNEALAMLRLLSGKVHEVITGVCITTKAKRVCFTVSTAVAFTVFDEDEITYYVDKYRPFDKAGSYGVQEWIGYIGVEAINGSYFNVMGLPVQRLYKELKAF